MTALTDGTRAEARRALHEKARSLMQKNGIDLTHALLKVWLDPQNAELVKLAHEPKPKRKPRATSEEMAKCIENLEASVAALSETFEKRKRRKS